MKKTFLTFLFLIGNLCLAYGQSVRLKELINIKGVRENPVIGYGLVVGLNGTGDSGGEIVNKSLTRMFQKLGLNPKQEANSQNVASVIVTAKLPPFARPGQKINVTVSSIGDASSLAGGTLMVTPLKAGDGNVYALANGPVSVGGLEKGGKFATTASIPNGGIVEKEIELQFDKKESLMLSLDKPDFTTAARIEKTINEELGGKYATAKDSGTVDLIVPVHYRRKVVSLVALVENFKVHTDRKAKIVINEKTGTVVAGGDLLLKPAAISHGDLSIEIGNGDQAGDEGENGKFYYVEKKATLNDLVKSLNAFGAESDDLISIFQALKENGALIGEIEML